ncbi:MAG: cell division protein FtsZ, partial [Rubrivivax sp.]|nr:cell division protein FtsZ [Rubrivivax sp.]
MTLSTALAILGAVVLLALALHTWWRLRRAAPKQSLDPVPDNDRVEPALGAADLPPADALATPPTPRVQP